MSDPRMHTYLGVKMVNARPMTRGEYNDFRGWQIPPDENPDDEGFLVEYLNGGPANTPHYNNYVSWSPRQTFIDAYRELGALTFGLAIEAMKMGFRVARAGWNGKGMHVGVAHPMPGTNLDHPYFYIHAVDGKRSAWVASQTDMMAEDWTVLEDTP